MKKPTVGVSVMVTIVVFGAGLWFATAANPSETSQLDQPLPASATHAELFDPSKVIAANLPSQTPLRKSTVVVWKDGLLDLRSYLRPGIPAESVSWAPESLVRDGYFRLGRRPAEDHIRSVWVMAQTAAGSDAFALVIAPPSAPGKFEDWLRQQRATAGWIQSLPPVYSRLGPGNSNPEPATCKPREWPTFRKIHTHYHPGAAYEMRSAIRPDGSGHQATYTASGELLRSGVSAGSADRGSPTWNIYRLIRHASDDVIPYLWAAQLDGNPVNPLRFYQDFDRPLMHEGEHIQAYLKVRPIYGPSHREIEPGQCIDSPTR